MPNNTPFSQQIAFINKGSLDDELTEVMSDLVQAVRLTRKAGTISLKLKIQLNQGHENIVKITPDVTCNMPKPDKQETIMWSTADGDLLRDDPVQGTLEFREIPNEDRIFKQLNEGRLS